MIEAKPSPRNTKPLLLIVLIAAMTTLIPYVMYYTGFGIPEETTNNGIFLDEAVLVGDFSFQKPSGEAWDLSEQQPKFRLVIPVRSDCDDSCRESLYLTRQVNTRLSDKSDQLQRLYVDLSQKDNANFQRYLASEHPDITYLQGDYQQWQAALGDQASISADFDGREYYLLHRYGALAMAYDQEHTGNELLDDLKFLIKTSN